MKSIKFPLSEDIMFIPDDYWLILWCCDCHLRHIYKINIVKNGKKQYVRMEGFRDDKGTELRRWYEKHGKQQTRKRK